MGHKGPISSLIYAPEYGSSGLVFSGSADRTIKLWDPWVRDPKDACVQTLVGHGGTITSLAQSKDRLVSSSNDQLVFEFIIPQGLTSFRTVMIWIPGNDRSLLLYPWFRVVQQLSVGSCWANSVALRVGESTSLFVADSHGNMLCYTPGTPGEMPVSC